MKILSDNIMMNDAYCEVTDCRDVESCEKCIELNIRKHDKQVIDGVIEEFDMFIKNFPSLLCHVTVIEEWEKFKQQLKEKNMKEDYKPCKRKKCSYYNYKICPHRKECDYSNMLVWKKNS